MPAACHEGAVGRVPCSSMNRRTAASASASRSMGTRESQFNGRPPNTRRVSALWELGSTREDVPVIVALRAVQPAVVWLALARRSDAWAGDRSAGIDDAEGRVGEFYHLTGDGWLSWLPATSHSSSGPRP